MSEADKMLDELGYRKYSEDEDKIIYRANECNGEYIKERYSSNYKYRDKK